MLAARPNFAPKETLPDKLLTHIASLGWEHIGFSGGYLLALRTPPKQKVSALRKLCSTFLDAAYRTDTRTDSAMTPISNK